MLVSSEVAASDIDTVEYAAVWPLGVSTVRQATLNPRPRDLSGTRVAFVWDYAFRGDEMFAVLEPALAARFEKVTFLSPDLFGNIHGGDEDAVMEALPSRLREHEVDVVIVAVGACGSCTPAVVRATAIAERAGVPAFAIVATAFLPTARAIVRTMGFEELALLEYPGVPMLDADGVLEANVNGVVLDAFLAALAASPSGSVDAADEPEWNAVVAHGSLDEIAATYYERGWTDGLPIVPPTVERVEAFVRHAGRDATEVLGVLPPERREASVWSVAVNGVMAGCLPEYMPVLVAITQAVADPQFRLQDAGSTPGWEPLVSVAGPVVEQLDLEYGIGAMKVGTRANSSIGRFLRLLLNNVGGLRHPPHGETDSGAIGTSFNVVLAENAQAVADIGWVPDHVEAGFEPDASVATVQSVFAISPPIYSAGSVGPMIAEPIAYHLSTTCGPWICTGLRYYRWHPLLLLGPAVAAAFAACGWDKNALRAHLYEHALIDGELTERYQVATGSEGLPLAELAERGGFTDAIVERDGVRYVRALLRPEWLRIVVAGHPGRNQSRVYVNNHHQGPPVAREIITS